MMTLMEQLKKRMSELGDAKGIIILESETIQGLIDEFDALVDEIDGNIPKENPRKPSNLVKEYSVRQLDYMLQLKREIPSFKHEIVIAQLDQSEWEAIGSPACWTLGGEITNSGYKYTLLKDVAYGRFALFVNDQFDSAHYNLFIPKLIPKHGIVIWDDEQQGLGTSFAALLV